MIAPGVDADDNVVFVCVAFALGHPPKGANVPSAYKLAHLRLHGERL